MRVYNIALERLMSFGFVDFENEIFESISGKCYKKDHLFVILQSWDSTTTVDDILSKARTLRSSLLEQRLNVWNTYYILTCDDFNVEEDTMFLVERDSTALRKYMIRTESDLNRIPFLDNTPVYKVDNPLSDTERALAQSNVVVDTLMNLIRLQKGENSKLSQDQMLKIAEAIIKE